MAEPSGNGSVPRSCDYDVVIVIVIATEGCPLLCMSGNVCPAGRLCPPVTLFCTPPDHRKMFRRMVVGVRYETMGIGVSQHAESIGAGPSSCRGH